MAKHDKTAGARAPLISEKSACMTLGGVIPIGHFAVYVSFEFCAIACHNMQWRSVLLLYYFFMSFMTYKKGKYNTVNIYRDLSEICAQQRHASFSRTPRAAPGAEDGGKSRNSVIDKNAPVRSGGGGHCRHRPAGLKDGRVLRGCKRRIMFQAVPTKTALTGGGWGFAVGDIGCE
jgi:hypothetical protein